MLFLLAVNGNMGYMFYRLRDIATKLSRSDRSPGNCYTKFGIKNTVDRLSVGENFTQIRSVFSTSLAQPPPKLVHAWSFKVIKGHQHWYQSKARV